MNKTLLTALFSLPLLATACNMNSIKLEHAYVRAMPAGQQTTAAYMLIDNKCDKELEITGVSSPAAGKVELHDVTMEDGVAKMHSIETLTLPAKEVTKLVPGSKHLMLIDVKQTLKPGSSIAMTLNFKDGSSKTIAVPVKDIRNEHEPGT